MERNHQNVVKVIFIIEKNDQERNFQLKNKRFRAPENLFIVDLIFYKNVTILK